MALQLVQEIDLYADGFRALLDNSGDGQPSWLRRVREAAFENFERIGFPTVKEEEWKYTNVTNIARTRFSPALNGVSTKRDDERSIAPFFYHEARQSQLVFLNGVHQKHLSSFETLPAGVMVVDFAEALRDRQHEAATREHFERFENAENGFTALNTALFSSGAFLVIPAGVAIQQPIHLLFVSQAQNGDAPASFPRVLIVAGANSSATVVENYVSPGSGSYLTNAVVDLVLESGARLQHYKIQREAASAFHVATSNADVGKDASYDTTSINLGATLSRHDIAVTLDHEGGECAVDGLYMIDASQHTDTHSVIDHRQPRCTSHQLYKGILDGKSRAVFNGKVFVRHGAQRLSR